MSNQTTEERLANVERAVRALLRWHTGRGQSYDGWQVLSASIPDPDAPVPEPEAGRWFVVDRHLDTTGHGFRYTEQAAKRLAKEYDASSPEDAPHLAIFAPTADAARAEYARRVDEMRKATEDPSVTHADVDALRTEIARLTQEREDAIKDAVHWCDMAMQADVRCEQNAKRAESAEAEVERLRALCREAAPWMPLTQSLLMARLAAASRGEAV
jgi:hypothetical protein